MKLATASLLQLLSLTRAISVDPLPLLAERNVRALVGDEPVFTFSLQMHWDQTSMWGTPNSWCMECEFHDADLDNQCFVGDKMVIGSCGSSPRQRFLYQETGGGQVMIMPVGNPDLCIAREGEQVRLRECDKQNPDQNFVGFEENGNFELSPDGAREYCIATSGPAPESDEEVYAIECALSREDRTSRWELASTDESCPTFCIDLWQDDYFIGQTQPVSTAQSVVQFYDYNKQDYSFNGDDVVKLVSDHSIIFVHQDSRNCDLAFVIVHDSKDDSTGGMAIMDISGDLENSAVQDGRDSPSDFYVYNSTTDETNASWEWSWQEGVSHRTDGIADWWYPYQRECITVSANFIDGITEWDYVPGPVYGRSNPDDYIELDFDKTLWICRGECPPPPPSKPPTPAPSQAPTNASVPEASPVSSPVGPTSSESSQLDTLSINGAQGTMVQQAPSDNKNIWIGSAVGLVVAAMATTAFLCFCIGRHPKKLPSSLPEPYFRNVASDMGDQHFDSVEITSDGTILAVARHGPNPDNENNNQLPKENNLACYFMEMVQRFRSDLNKQEQESVERI